MQVPGIRQSVGADPEPVVHFVANFPDTKRAVRRPAHAVASILSTERTEIAASQSLRHPLNRLGSKVNEARLPDRHALPVQTAGGQQVFQIGQSLLPYGDQLNGCPYFDRRKIDSFRAAPGQSAAALDELPELAIGMRQTIDTIARRIYFRWRNLLYIRQLRCRHRRG